MSTEYLSEVTGGTLAILRCHPILRVVLEAGHLHARPQQPHAGLDTVWQQQRSQRATHVDKYNEKSEWTS